MIERYMKLFSPMRAEVHEPQKNGGNFVHRIIVFYYFCLSSYFRFIAENAREEMPLNIKQ